MGHYSLWLIIPAVAGIPVQIYLGAVNSYSTPTQVSQVITITPILTTSRTPLSFCLLLITPIPTYAFPLFPFLLFFRLISQSLDGILLLYSHLGYYHVGVLETIRKEDCSGVGYGGVREQRGHQTWYCDAL